MFNLEQQISDWRKQMLDAGVRSPVPLDELENHLREDIAGRISLGDCEQNAFENAIRQLGQSVALKTEFDKARETIQERFWKFLLGLAGIPNLQLITDMNTTNSNLEPRWATYAKAGASIFPAAFLWLFTAVFVLPKVNQICQSAGITVFNFTGAPAVFRGSAIVGQGMVFLTNHLFLFSAVIILAVVLLERYFQSWPRYRRLTIGLGVYLLNTVILIALTLMIVSIIVAAPNATYHGH